MPFFLLIHIRNEIGNSFHYIRHKNACACMDTHTGKCCRIQVIQRTNRTNQSVRCRHCPALPNLTYTELVEVSCCLFFAANLNAREIFVNVWRSRVSSSSLFFIWQRKWSWNLHKRRDLHDIVLIVRVSSSDRCMVNLLRTSEFLSHFTIHENNQTIFFFFLVFFASFDEKDNRRKFRGQGILYGKRRNIVSIQ